MEMSLERGLDYICCRFDIVYCQGDYLDNEQTVFSGYYKEFKQSVLLFENFKDKTVIEFAPNNDNTITIKICDKYGF